MERSGMIQIQRGNDGKFVCDCGNSYHRAQALKRHKQGCYASIAIAGDMENNSDYEEGISNQSLIHGTLFSHAFTNYRPCS